MTQMSPDSLDALLLDYYDRLFFDGRHVGDAEKTAAGLKHCFPTILRGSLPTCLPRSMKALRGWSRYAPGRMRLPLPEEALLALVGVFMFLGRGLTALAIFVQYDLYLRPGELMECCPEHLIVPHALHVQNLLEPCGMIVRPSIRDLGGPAPAGKTGEHDESVLFSPRAQLARNSLMLLARTFAPGVKLFPGDFISLNRDLKTAAHQALIENLEPSPYSLRHGGASRDFIKHHFTLPEIQLRGRWRSTRSLRRYQKEGMYQKQTSSMHAAAIHYGAQIAASLPLLFHTLETELQAVLSQGLMVSALAVESALQHRGQLRRVTPPPPIR
jgi:hypothetical protein